MTSSTRTPVPRVVVPYALFAIGVSVSPRVAACQDAYLPALDYGPFDVGFETLFEWDRSRTFRSDTDSAGFPRENARPMLISVWYPAVRSAGAGTMPFREYVHLSAQIERFQTISTEERHTRDSLYGVRDGVDDARIEALLRAPTRAVRDAARREGRYPLIIYSPGGNGPPHENSVLLEYIASHGYVVAHIPSYASRTVTKGPEAFDLDGVEVGARDLEFVYQRMRSYPLVDARRLGVVSFSWGGLADVVFANRNHDVDALVSLDGGIGYRDLLGGLETHPRFDPTRLHAPFLHMLSTGMWERDRFYAEFHPNVPHDQVYVVKFFDLTHSEFASNWIMRNVNAAEVAADVRSSKNRGFAIVARLTRVFLDIHLKGDERARSMLETALSGHSPDGDIFTLERVISHSENR